MSQNTRKQRDSTPPCREGRHRAAERRSPSADASLRARSGRVRFFSRHEHLAQVHETELCRRYREFAANLTGRLVSMEMGVSLDALHARTRSTATIAFSRQVALYLTSTVFDIGHTEVGQLFGRDRTTVRHACAKVEDRRDDQAFEARLIAMETQLGEARAAMQLFAVQTHTMTDRVLTEIGVLPRRIEDRR